MTYSKNKSSKTARDSFGRLIEVPYFDPSDSLYRHVRFLPQQNQFVCNLAPFLRFDTLEAAVQHRDYLESEFAEREARRADEVQYA